MSQILQPTSISRESRHREITFEEFLNWDGDNQHVEWVDGKVEELSPVSKLHQQVGGFLISLLRLYSRTRLNGEVLYEPFVMRVAPELPARSPDTMFISKEHIHLLRDNFLDGPADLVIEIVSPGRASVDLVTKRAEYDYGKVGEYWVIDPYNETTAFFCRAADEEFSETKAESDGWFTSVRLLGLHLHVGWLWSHDVLSETEIETSWAMRDGSK